MKKEMYETPELECINVTEEDVIRTSGGEGGNITPPVPFPGV